MYNTSTHHYKLHKINKELSDYVTVLLCGWCVGYVLRFLLCDICVVWCAKCVVPVYSAFCMMMVDCMVYTIFNVRWDTLNWGFTNWLRPNLPKTYTFKFYWLVSHLLLSPQRYRFFPCISLGVVHSNKFEKSVFFENVEKNKTFIFYFFSQE